MKNIIYLSIGIVLSMYGGYITTVEVHAVSHAKLPILCLADVSDQHIDTMMHRIQQALSFSNQCQVNIQQLPEKLSKQYIKKLHAQGYALVLIVTCVLEDRLEWRLYDTLTAAMVAGKTVERNSSDRNWWALRVVQGVWPELTGLQGSFITKIAYSKRIRCPKGNFYKHIYIADFDGKHEQMLVTTPTINIVPRWNKDIHNPLLFYSEYTNANVRMMVVNTHKERRIASNFEGINMLTTFSGDGKKVVYCASRGDTNCQMYYHENGVFKRLRYTDSVSGKSLTDGNNISPSLSFAGDIVYFCSDFQTPLPQIYAYHMTTDTVTRITNGGYCASPHYCHANNKVVYTKKIDNNMQLYVYDPVTGNHVQITHDPTSKDECSWSPCGNYIVFAAEANDLSRVAVLNVMTKEMIYITPEGIDCSYPSWSPLYPTFVMGNGKQDYYKQSS